VNGRPRGLNPELEGQDMSESMASPSLRCAIYLHVSKEEQSQRDFTEEGYTLPAQREACL